MTIIRFRSKDGTHRVNCENTDLFGTVLDKLLPHLDPKIDPNSLVISATPGGSHEPIGSLVGRTVESLGLKHGDMLYVKYQTHNGHNNSSDLGDNTAASVNIGSSVNLQGKNQGSLANVKKELPIDQQLEKEEGYIERKRSSLCKHGERGMCEYCSPLPPWDKNYHEENNIKHISFHSYLKKLNEATNKKSGSGGGSYLPPLSQPDFKINKNCSNGHEPWPRGICSKCQPSAITLQQQEFRMVDHVEFQSSELINEFIEAWRDTGMQRLGYLYGSYAKYPSSPLGIKAVVEAIYEPAQHDEADGLTIDMEQVKSEMEQIDKLAERMGLLPVGVIFTDLTDAGNGDGSVFCKRHKDSFFLSSLEIIMAAKHQRDHPNVSKYSKEGVFSSKFVTCVVSGNLQGDIDISCYQVSTDAEALVDGGMISGSTHPSMAYINETTNERYVPEIFYMKKNEYGLTVKENAKPAFPADYLLVSLTHGFPTGEVDSNDRKFLTVSGFPWSNRQSMGQSQDYHELKRYLGPVISGTDLHALLNKLSNFHLLLYLHTLQILSEEEWSHLVKATTSRADDDSEALLYQVLGSPGWQTFALILQETQ